MKKKYKTNQKRTKNFKRKFFYIQFSINGYFKIKDLDQTGPLTAVKTRKHFALVHIYSYQRININALLKQDLVPVEIYMDLLLLN